MNDTTIPPQDEYDPTPVLPEPDGKSTRVVFDDLTLGQALAYLIWRPVRTSRLFWAVLTRESDEYAMWDAPDDETPEWGDDGSDAAADADGTMLWEAARDEGGFETGVPDDDAGALTSDAALTDVAPPQQNWLARYEHAPWIGLLVVVILLAAKGGQALYDASLNPILRLQRDSNGALGWFVAAGALYAGAAVLAGRGWWVQRFPSSVAALQARMVRGGPEMRRVWNAGLGFLMAAAIWIALLMANTVWMAGAFLAVALMLWIVIVIGNAPAPAARRVAVATDDTRDDGTGPPEPYVVRSVKTSPRPPAARRFSFWRWFNASAAQLILVPFALLLSTLTYYLNVRQEGGVIIDIVLTLPGVLAWVGSVLLWIVVLGVDVRALPRRVRTWTPLVDLRARLVGVRVTWEGVALLAIVAVGAYFRLHALESTPPEMTSDHIEKVLDALKVKDGYYAVFFPNNEGREGFQMFLVAVIADWFGVGFNFTALKLASVLEGIVTIPAMWWMARQVFGRETDRARQLGAWTGLAAAGLLAISSWHVMLSRLGLRIALTPLTAALLAGFLARALRHNRMRDYIAVGVVLGAGTYFYQANRMLPVVVAAGVALAMLAQVRRPRELGALAIQVIGLGALVGAPLLVIWYGAELLQQGAKTARAGARVADYLPVLSIAWIAICALAVRASRERFVSYAGGLLASAVIALAIFVPMYHYSTVHSYDFWNRTRGRMFGMHAFMRLDPVSGYVLPYDPPLDEQLEQFWDQRDVFFDNYWDALLMYTWEGDGAWINNAHSAPALDALSGGLLLLGAMMWVVRGVRRRDPVDAIIPLTVLIMLLPTALTVAYTSENPSFTRASGTIPPVFLLAAVPLGMLGWRLSQVRWARRRLPLGTAAGLLLVAGVMGAASRTNWDRYFTDYRLLYSNSWKPYSAIAEPLEEFATGEGSFGNAFVIAYPHWLDHRILGAMAGDIRWPNGLASRGDFWAQTSHNAGTPYVYDPTKPLFFMYNLADSETEAWLQENFPGGTASTFVYSYEALDGMRQGSFRIYVVKLGEMDAQTGS